MSAAVFLMPQRGNIVIVQPCKAGFEILLSPLNGDRRQLGTRAHFAEARTFAQNEAFKIGRCRVRILGTRGRS